MYIHIPKKPSKSTAMGLAKRTSSHLASTPAFGKRPWGNGAVFHDQSILSHMLHGAGIFTYKTGSQKGGKCWQIYQHHGALG